MLATDHLEKQQPELRESPLVLFAPRQGRMLVTAANLRARQEGILPGSTLSDAKMALPELLDFPDHPQQTAQLLDSLALWCMRFTPAVAADSPDSVLLDISGCAHLWGGEEAYLAHIVERLKQSEYTVRAAISDTATAAWALAHFGEGQRISPTGQQSDLLAALPPAALRLEEQLLRRMEKLGFRSLGQFMSLPPAVLRRRFGQALLLRLGQALGSEPEAFTPMLYVPPYQERLSSLEGIRTGKGIEIALQKLLGSLCRRLENEGKGIRSAVLKAQRMDGKIEQIAIGTSRASCNPEHLFRLFALKIPQIRPALGIELFILEAILVEEVTKNQEALWKKESDSVQVAELLDRLAGKVGIEAIRRYLPSEHHWPERSIRRAASLDELPQAQWPSDQLRPLHLLSSPEPISVMVVLPDYPPLSFTYKGRPYKLVKAEGPERLEQEWWIQQGQSRDYYRVEDESGARYWLFRQGQYGEDPKWFLHGFFA